MLALRDVQTRFLRSIATAPGPTASGSFDAALLRVVHGDARQSSRDRLDVYAQMYWLRLHDALYEDYPRVAAILGDERFTAIARAYLARFPSANPSMRHVGAQFADFLARRRETAAWPFLPDLARLEWARLAVFDAADTPVLGIEEVRALAAPEWPDIVFRPIPALRILRSPWPVHELWSETTGRARTTRPAETHLRVWRREFAVYQAPMDACERLALESLVSGAPFAAMCATLAILVDDPARAAREAAQLVLRWVEDGILARVNERDLRALIYAQRLVEPEPALVEEVRHLGIAVRGEQNEIVRALRDVSRNAGQRVPQRRSPTGPPPAPPRRGSRSPRPGRRA